MKKAFTLMEVTIVLGLLIALAGVAIMLMDPWTQLGKADDSRRKNDMATFKKVLEDWYNDKSCYPKPNEICYDGVTPSNNSCHVCGSETRSPSLAPYLQTLICDPKFPAQNYLYIYDDAACPTSYQVFTDLSQKDDNMIREAGCGSGCGPGAIYNYGISSSNVSLMVLPTIIPSPTP